MYVIKLVSGQYVGMFETSELAYNWARKNNYEVESTIYVYDYSDWGKNLLG